MEPPEAPETPLTLNPGVRVFPFDGASPRPTVLCEVTEEGEVVGRYTVPAEVAELMRTFDGTRATDRVVRDWCAANPGAPPPERCNQLVREVLQPRGLLLRAGAPAGTGVPPRRPSPVYLTYRVRLLPWAAVRPLARALGWTFAPPVVVLLLAVVVAAHVVFYLGLGQHPSIAGFTGADAVRLGLLSSLGALVHELGHATASVRYGCRKIEIGWGLYWYMTVLYTDRSEA